MKAPIRPRAVAAAAVALLASTPLLWPAPRSPAGKHEIAFLRLTSGYWQVWSMDGDGGHARQLTRTPVDKVHVAWRPDGSQLLYHSNQGESVLLDVATGAEEAALPGLNVTDAAWSPDGRRVAYSLPPEDLAKGKTTLWLSNLDGTDRRKLAGGNGSDALAPGWLGDGGLLFRQCVMVSNMEVRHDFLTIDPADGAPPETVSGDDDRLKFDQAVSAGGSIAYSAPRTGSYEVWTLPRGAGGPRQVTRLGSYAGNPGWSPDGQALAFDSTANGPVQVYRVQADGTGLRPLTRGEPSRKPVWRPRPTVGDAEAFTMAKSRTPASPPPAPAESRRAATPAPGALGIRWVSTDRARIDPGRGEAVTVRFQVSAPAQVTLRWIDPHHHVVRTQPYAADAAGDHKVAWDGRDDAGTVVPAEAYAYTLTARDEAGDEARYDLRAQTAGRQVWAQDTAIDAKTGRIRYRLGQASRVRLIVGRSDTTWPVRTLLDWAPRAEGPHEEPWDGRDASGRIEALKTPNLTPIFYAFSLPRNSVIVTGQTGSQNAARTDRPGRAEVAPPSAEGGPRPSDLHLHARHPRERCFDPPITMSWPGRAGGEDEVLALTEPTPLRLDLAPVEGANVPPIPRVSVFIYVDGVPVERFLVGYTPFHWIADPAKLGPGEHVITGLLAWRDDHFGIKHLRVRVPARDALGHPDPNAARGTR